MPPASHSAGRHLHRRATAALGCALASLLLYGAPSAQAVDAAAVDTPYGVTIVVPEDSPHVGVPFTITGEVSPAAGRAVIKLQRFIGGAFQTVAKDKLDRKSSYEFIQTGQAVGGLIYRVVKPADKGGAVGYSPQRRIFITGETLRSGPTMHAGDALVSSDGSYRFMMQANGNLSILLTTSGRLIWSMGTAGNPGAWAVLQRDGNLVVHAPDGAVLETTGTGGHPRGSYGVRIRDDSNLAIQTPDGNPFWSSATINSRLGPTELLRSGQYLTSAGGSYRLDMQADGNVVLSDTDDDSTDWATNTDEPGSTLVMQPRGTLVVIGPFGRVLWSSRTAGFPGGYAILQSDGNFVIYQEGVARWASRGLGGVLGDDYPAELRDADKDSIIDPWRFYNRECTSFVAWRMNSANHVDFSNFMAGGRFGNAYNWDDNARALGYVVNSVPARGAIAQSDSEGHVSWVAAVGNGTVTIEDYNYSAPGDYGTRTVPTSRYVYIHIDDM